MTRFWPGRPPHRAILEAVASVEHFADPARYDATYRSRTHDVAFYVRLAAAAGRVLELGCGSGRLTLPMAHGGAEVTGLDRSEAMLGALRLALAASPEALRARVHASAGDMRAFRVAERFPLVVCPFNTFLHLYTREDVERFLACVRDALLPGGMLVFDVSVPRGGDLRDRTPRGRRLRLLGRTWSYTEAFQYEPLEQILYVTLTWTPLDGGDPVRQVLAHRQFFPAELEALLHHGGFDVVGATEWGRPLGRNPDTLVLRCRVRA